MSDLQMELLMKSIKYLLFIIFFSVFVGRAQDKPKTIEDSVVARLDKNYLVTLKDLRQHITDWKYQRRFRDKSVIYRNALKEMTTDRLRIFDFFDRKLNENQDLMRNVRPVINNELINTFFDKNFVEKYANEKTAAKAYKEMDKKIICNVLTLQMPEHPKKEELDSLRMIALEIEAGLSKNNDIKDLIRSHSLKDIKQVYKREVTWSESMIDPVANVIFGLKKGFTRVIESADGFHIIKVLDIKQIKLQPFEKMKDKIVSQLKKGYDAASNKAYDDFRLGRVDKRSVKWNQSGLDQIIKWSSENVTFYRGAYKDTMNNAIRNGNNFEILSYKNVKVDLKEYLRLLQEVIFLNPDTYLDSNNIKGFILDAVYDNNIIMAAIKNGLDNKLINPYTQNRVIADRLLYVFNQAVIEASIPQATPEALNRFYEDHKDPIFYQLKKVFIYARVYSDSAKAAADINEIRNGTPFEKVQNSMLIKIFIRERDGQLKTYRTPGGDYLAKAANNLSLNESAGPIAYDDSTEGKQYAVIKAFRIDPEKQLTYDEVKGERIEEEFKNYYRQKITDEVDAGLKKKYSVEIYEDVLSKAIVSK
jgi:hypothetical protein